MANKSIQQLVDEIPAYKDAEYDTAARSSVFAVMASILNKLPSDKDKDIMLDDLRDLLNIPNIKRDLASSLRL